MALRRGIAGYANGTNNVPGYADGTPDTPATFAPLALGNAAQRGPRSVAPVAITPPPPTAPAAPPAAALWSQPTPSPAFSQILQGQFSAAQQNPNVSPVQAAAARLGQQIQTAKRAADLVNPPSPMEWVTHMFTGTPASGAILQQRQDTAEKLANPVVQRGLVAHPDYLNAAEQDPKGFADQTTNSEFMKNLQTAADNHAIASAGIPVTDDAGNQRTITDHDPVVVGKTMGDHDLPPAAAVAASQGHLLSRDEFINSLRGTPTKIIQMLFGAQLAHVPQVHDIIAKTYFDAKEAQLAKQRADIAELEKRADPRQSSLLKKMKEDLIADEKAHVQEMGIYSGVYQRPYVMTPGGQQP